MNRVLRHLKYNSRYPAPMIGWVLLLAGALMFLYALILDGAKIIGVAIIPVSVGMIFGPELIPKLLGLRARNRLLNTKTLAVFFLTAFAICVFQFARIPDDSVWEQAVILAICFSALIAALFCIAIEQEGTESEVEAEHLDCH